MIDLRQHPEMPPYEIECPECHSTELFRIDMSIVYNINNNGIYLVDHDQDLGIQPGSMMECVACEYYGDYFDFLIDEEDVSHEVVVDPLTINDIHRSLHQGNNH